MPDSTKPEDGRRGRRRMQPRPIGAYPGVSPGLIIAAPSEPLPGEDAPLVAEPGRTKPISEDEALGVWRRKKRAEIAKRVAADDKQLKRFVRKGLPAEHEAEVPSRLPEWSDKKVMVAFRLHPTLRALVDAQAELEQTNFATELELALWKLVTSPPRDPEAVQQELIDMAAATVVPERLARQFKRR